MLRTMARLRMGFALKATVRTMAEHGSNHCETSRRFKVGGFKWREFYLEVPKPCYDPKDRFLFTAFPLK